MLMLIVPLLHLHYPAAAQMDALRISMKSSMSSRRSFSSQLPVEDFCVCFFSAVSYTNDCLVETFGHVITVNTLFTLYIVFWYSLSHCMCVT
jgi:hypothetical protein